MRFSLLQPLSQIPIAVIDTETTGASPQFGHRVTEIGIVRLEAGKETARYQQLVDPQRPISPGVTALTGITNAMVAGQPRFVDQLPAMLQIMEGAAILGHNINFDLGFLASELRRSAISPSATLAREAILDTVRIARRRFGRGGNSLPILSRRLGVVPNESHRALADAVTTARVFEQLLIPVGGWERMLIDVMGDQGGPIIFSGERSNSALPIELEESLENARPVKMEYLDARGTRTERIIQPLHVRRYNEELILVAHCHLRNDRRTFKLDRIVRLIRMET